MKYPCLVPKAVCTTPIVVEIQQEGSNRGEPLELIKVETMCNYQDSAKTVWTADKKQIQLTGKAYIPGEICPQVPVISGGYITVNGAKRKLYRGTKARNPDSTVNHTVLEVE